MMYLSKILLKIDVRFNGIMNVATRIRALYALFFLFSLQLSGQDLPRTNSRKAIDAYNSAIQDYSMHRYEQAAAALKSAITADPQFMDARMLLAEVYEDMNNRELAIQAYAEALEKDPGFYPYGFVRLGNLLFNEGRYGEAESSYLRFLDMHTPGLDQNEKARMAVDRCRFAMEAVANPVPFKPVNLGPSVNSPQDDYWPSLSADEKILVITRLVESVDLRQKVQEDFFISEWKDTAWDGMRNAGKPLNTHDNEGAQSLTADGRMMVFTACNRSTGIGKCDLYYSIRQGNEWTEPRNIGKTVNSVYRETQPAISADGRTLYFASNRPGGYGQHDIWVTYLDENGLWSKPVNCGELINTAGNEMSPFIHPDNKTLYFSSDGHPGLGGYDLFLCRTDSLNKTMPAENLGYPVNTHRDEIGLIVNARADKAYFSSDVDRKWGKDIYTFDLPVEKRPLQVSYMKGRVFNADNWQPLRASFELTDLENRQVIYKSYSDSSTGEFLVSIPTNRNYMLTVNRKGYLFYSGNFTLRGIYEAPAPFLQDVPLQPVQVGRVTVLNNVFFETDSYELKPESESELEKVTRFLGDNPAIRIEISGHTDNTGGDQHNQVLSEKRASAVAGYLVLQGISAARIESRGYGSAVPAAENTTSEGRALNRRTEMKIIE